CGRCGRRQSERGENGDPAESEGGHGCILSKGAPTAFTYREAYAEREAKSVTTVTGGKPGRDALGPGSFGRRLSSPPAA
ncbi:MAG: hypothetical protein ACREIP_05755, partial [Alphaproteobacteria bacterium]